MTGNLFGITTDYRGTFLELFFYLAWWFVSEIKRPCHSSGWGGLAVPTEEPQSQVSFFPLPLLLLSEATARTQYWENAIKMSQLFHDIARFKHFTDLNLFKYVVHVIHNWETDALQFYFMVLFLLSVMVEGDESSRLRMAN